MPAITEPCTHSDSVYFTHTGPNDRPAVGVPSLRLVARDRAYRCSLFHRICLIRSPLSYGLWERKQIP